MRRYILALIIILLPTFIESLIAGLLPSSHVINQDSPKNSSYGTFKLDLLKYTPNAIPYIVYSDQDSKFAQLLETFYSSSNRPGVDLIKLDQPVPNYVFDKHKTSLYSLVNQYYFGMTWKLADSINDLEIIGYYSKMAYNTPGVVLNEISNLLLAKSNNDDINKTITTYNSPLLPEDPKYNGNDFLKYIDCFDILPISLFNFATSIVIGLVISKFYIYFFFRI